MGGGIFVVFLHRPCSFTPPHRTCLCPAAPLEESQKWVLEGGDEIVLQLRCPSSTWIATFGGLQQTFGIESGELLKNGEMKEDVI